MFSRLQTFFDAVGYQRNAGVQRCNVSVSFKLNRLTHRRNIGNDVAAGFFYSKF